MFQRVVIARPGLCELKQSDLRNEIASCLAMTIFDISVIGFLPACPFRRAGVGMTIDENWYLGLANKQSLHCLLNQLRN